MKPFTSAEILDLENYVKFELEQHGHTMFSFSPEQTLQMIETMKMAIEMRDSLEKIAALADINRHITTRVLAIDVLEKYK